MRTLVSVLASLLMAVATAGLYAPAVQAQDGHALSGRWEGKAECFGPLVADLVVGKLVPGEFQFAQKWRIMSADDHCVVGIMQGGGPGLNGEMYHQTYCQVFTIESGEIVELHEFYDTAMVERVLNDNPTERPPTPQARPFTF